MNDEINLPSHPVDELSNIVTSDMTAAQAAAVAKHVTDADWTEFDDHIFIACCDCGLSHRVEVRGKPGRYRVRTVRQDEYTAEIRKLHSFPLAPRLADETTDDYAPVTSLTDYPRNGSEQP